VTFGARSFWLDWAGFAAFFLLLQYVVNDTAGVFAVVMSIVAAAPVAALVAYAQRRRTR
jgi:hypothetical protein